MIKRFLIALLICLSATLGWATDYYIDPSAGTNGVGTFADPYNTWSGITISTGNDYRQKCGTNYTGTVTISASGTSGDYIVIGAYNTDGSFEDGGNETFGANCSGGSAKPVIRYDTSGRVGNAVYISTANYIEINSIQTQYSQHGVRVDGNNNKVRYTYHFHNQYGVRVGLGVASDSNLIEYSYTDLDENVDETGATQNCYSLQSLSDNSTVQYNHCTGYDHAGIFQSSTTGNILQYNYIYGDSTYHTEDNCFDMITNTDNNIIRYNSCNNAGKGISILGADTNEIYGNLFVCNNATKPSNYAGCIQLDENGSYTVQNNIIYNNVIYDNNNQTDNKGFVIRNSVGETGNMSGNKFYNNIIQLIGNDCIAVIDNAGTIGTNYFYNNICYNYGGVYAAIEGSDKTVAQLNAEAYASGNLDADPGMNDPANDEFWPANGASAIVGAGCDANDSGTDCYDAAYTASENILDPDNTTTDASPPAFALEVQPASWLIGAYGETGSTGPTPTLRAVSLSGVKIN